MDIGFTLADEDFRREVRDFICATRNEAPADAKASTSPKDTLLSWHRALFRRGWIAPSWPKQYGGPGWTATQKYLFAEECAAADTPVVVPFGVQMVGPVIYTFGSDEQKSEYLPKILSGDHWWCQGYSEPGSGSDLASLKTRAVRDGDNYIVNGQKTWTTLAQFANWIFCLVRTDPKAKQQEGISFLLIDMSSPGVSVRPIMTIDGGHEINEVFFEDVKVPVKNLIGKENEGWTYAKFLLSHERAGLAGVARSKRAVERLKGIAKTEREDGRALLECAVFTRNLTELEVDLEALEFTELRTLAAESAGGHSQASSILKIKGTDIQQRLSELTLEAVGYYAAPYRGHSTEERSNEYLPGPEYASGVAQNYFLTRRVSIFGGTNEIQRNIIAKMVLGV